MREPVTRAVPQEAAPGRLPGDPIAVIDIDPQTPPESWPQVFALGDRIVDDYQPDLALVHIHAALDGTRYVSLVLRQRESEIKPE